MLFLIAVPLTIFFPSVRSVTYPLCAAEIASFLHLCAFSVCSFYCYISICLFIRLFLFQDLFSSFPQSSSAKSLTKSTSATTLDHGSVIPGDFTFAHEILHIDSIVTHKVTLFSWVPSKIITCFRFVFCCFKKRKPASSSSTSSKL